MVNHNNRKLDLVLLNLENIEVNGELIPLVPLDLHHPVIVININNQRIEKQNNNTFGYNFSKVDFIIILYSFLDNFS